MANQSICTSRQATYSLTKKPCIQVEHFFLYCVIISHWERAAYMQIDSHRDFLCSEQLSLFHFSQTLLDPVSAYTSTLNIQYSPWSLFKMFS